MNKQALQILVVEDNPGDARLLMEMLREAGPKFSISVHADRLGDALRKVATTAFDVILLDLSLPDSKGLETVLRTRQAAGATPLVVITGMGDDELAMQALNNGVQDYLVKGEVNTQWLTRSISYAIERKRAEWIEQERRSLQLAVRGMDRMLASVAHDLRIPLASLRMTSELLMDEDEAVDEAQTTKFLTSIHNEVLRMTRMVDDILESARLESATAKWQWSVVKASQVCRDALEVVAPWVNDKPIEIGWECAEPDLKFHGDADAVRRLLVNLLSNAIKNTSCGRIDVNVTTKACDGELWIMFSVRDSGAGIPDEVAEQLGNAFALNTGVVDSLVLRGVGLGLAICKGIAAAHGGKISFITTPDHGSTFTARLRADLSSPMDFMAEAELFREAA
jgi:signal transduction histidine kinase